MPVELRIFLTAAAIVDDIGVDRRRRAVLLRRARSACSSRSPSRSSARSRCSTAPASTACRPTSLLGVALWACVHAGGLHATLAGVVLALFIPTRPPPNLRALTAAGRRDHRRRVAARRRGAAPRPLDRRRCARSMRSTTGSSRPADRMLRHVEPWSSYLVLPLFALANAGVAIDARRPRAAVRR